GSYVCRGCARGFGPGAVCVGRRRGALAERGLGARDRRLRLLDRGGLGLRREGSLLGRRDRRCGGRTIRAAAADGRERERGEEGSVHGARERGYRDQRSLSPCPYTT